MVPLNMLDNREEQRLFSLFFLWTQPPEAKDFCGERELAGCKFSGETAKQRKIAIAAPCDTTT